MTIRAPTQAERIASLETQVQIMSENMDKMVDKMDELLAFRNKGIGALLLITSLLGTGLTGVVLTFMSWFHH